MIELVACRTSPIKNGGNPLEAMVKDKIISKPDKLFEFSDDKEALDLLFELGLIDEFSISNPPGKTTVQVITGDLPTHHVIATRFAGNPEAEENGYWVLCIPKSLYSVEEVNDHRQTIVGRFQSQGLAVETVIPMFPLSSDITNRVVLRG
jgi:hypothetical protein